MESQSISLSPAAVYDILPCIISHLDPDDPNNWATRVVRRALIGLAITHSTFTKPALSALWRSLPGDDVLNHLLCVLGIAKEVPREEGWSGPRLELCGVPNVRESGWQRFRKYATFVRKIVVNPTRITRLGGSESPAIFLHDTFWCQIASILGEVPILPSLTAIRFISVDSGRTIDLGALRLLHPRIQELTVEFHSIRDESQMPRLKATFASCFSSTPGLERLSLETRFFILDLDSLPQSHPGLRSLRVFERITPHHLTSLASLPVLESLDISLSEPVKTPIRFEKLLSLSIAHDLDTAATLITSMDAPCLRNLSLNSFHPDSLSLRAELSQCLHPLVARFPSLTGFHWRCSQESDRSYGYYGSRNPNGTLAELLEPLFSLRPLRDVSLRLSGPIVPYSSTDFKRMAEAWPALETLALDLDHPDSADLDPRYRRLVPHWSGSTPPVQQADLETFAAFARLCPRLHIIRIPRVWMESTTNVPRLLALPSESESELGCTRTLTRHGLRLLNVREILCPEAPQGLGSVRFNNRKNEAFREVMGPVFPFARFQLPIVV